MNNIKQKRISSDINKALCEIILEESRDSVLKNITITGCEVTNDLSFCKVFFTFFSLLYNIFFRFELSCNFVAY